MRNYINHSEFSTTLTTTVHTKFQVVGLKKMSIIGDMMCHLVRSQMLQLVGHHAIPRVQVSLPTTRIVVCAIAKTLMPVESTRVAL